MNLQKQMDLLQARVDSATSRKGEFNKKQQETISELEGKVFELKKHPFGESFQAGGGVEAASGS